MPYKDNNGVWRNDTFTGDNGKKPKRCPSCKNKNLDYDRMMDDDEIDEELESDWHLGEHRAIGNYAVVQRLEPLLSFTPSYAVCEECGAATAYGPDYYYNPTTNAYDLQRPLTSAEIVVAEAEAQRIAQETAGQLPLIKGGE